MSDGDDDDEEEEDAGASREARVDLTNTAF